MNDQITPNQPQNDSPVPSVPPANTPPPTSKIPSMNQVKNSIGPLMKDVFGKLYENKRVFYLITSLLGLILLVVIAGVIYKMSDNLAGKAKAVPTVTPEIQTDVVEENLSPLQKLEKDLMNAKVKIDNLDVKQLQLAPPAIDYKVNF